MSTVRTSAEFRFAQIFERLKTRLGLWELSESVSQLNRMLARAKTNRFVERLATPRRFVLSLLAIALAFVWLGQAVVGILFRPSTSLHQLMAWIPISLAGYFLWNL
ncbi:MAG: hypothetical protein AAGA30_10275, partial [Planctomycetota bacterium]